MHLFSNYHEFKSNLQNVSLILTSWSTEGEGGCYWELFPGVSGAWVHTYTPPPPPWHTRHLRTLPGKFLICSTGNWSPRTREGQNATCYTGRVILTRHTKACKYPQTPSKYALIVSIRGSFTKMIKCVKQGEIYKNRISWANGNF